MKIRTLLLMSLILGSVVSVFIYLSNLSYPTVNETSTILFSVTPRPTVTTATPTVKDIVTEPAKHADRYVKLLGKVYHHQERGEIVMDDSTALIRLEYPSAIPPIFGEKTVVEGYVRWPGGKAMPYIEVAKTYPSS